MGPHELWDEPWEGLPEEEGAWEWDLVLRRRARSSHTNPKRQRGGPRWRFGLVWIFRAGVIPSPHHGGTVGKTEKVYQCKPRRQSGPMSREKHCLRLPAHSTRRRHGATAAPVLGGLASESSGG